MKKRSLYETFIERIDHHISAADFFEASWYIYAVLEDRMVSMLQNSGGSTQSNGRPIRMLGPKLSMLKTRATTDSLLDVNFPHDAIFDWKERRNDLMHAMAEGTLDINQIDTAAKSLAEEGQELVRTVSACAMRLKKHRGKV